MLRKALVILATTAVLALASPSPAANQIVRAAGVTFGAPVVVASGADTITLNILDLLPHSFTTDVAICAVPTGKVACDTDAFSGFNQARTVTLSATPGTYDFYCKVHRSLGMVGKLVVR